MARRVMEPASRRERRWRLHSRRSRRWRWHCRTSRRRGRRWREAQTGRRRREEALTSRRRWRRWWHAGPRDRVRVHSIIKRDVSAERRERLIQLVHKRLQVGAGRIAHAPTAPAESAPVVASGMAQLSAQELRERAERHDRAVAGRADQNHVVLRVQALRFARLAQVEVGTHDALVALALHRPAAAVANDVRVAIAYASLRVDLWCPRASCSRVRLRTARRVRRGGSILERLVYRLKLIDS